MAPDPLEFCDLCFQRGKPTLCETYKNTFTKISPIHFSQQSKLDRVLNRLQATPRLVERRWTCTLVPSARREFLDSLWGIGVTVHTLDDHAKVLTRLYKPETRLLGDPCTVELPSMDTWKEFDPETRGWLQIPVKGDGQKFTVRSRLGNVLKYSGVDGDNYYRINKSGSVISLISMERRAAYNIACTVAKPLTVQWRADGKEQYVFISVRELGTVPDEMLSFLKRLGKSDKKLDGMLYFEKEDLDLVGSALACIKIRLEKSNEPLDFASSTRSGMPIGIGSIEKERLDVLVGIIHEMGGEATTSDTHLEVSGKKGSVKMRFTDEERSSQSGTDLLVAKSALEDPVRFSEVLSSVRKKLGLLDVPVESSVASHWPVLNESDLQYVVQSAISWYGSNPTLAVKIISGNNKLGKIREWNKKIIEGKIRSTLDTVTLGKIIKRLDSN